MQQDYHASSLNFPVLNLVAAIKNEDQGAYVAVYNQFHKKVFHYFLKRTAEQDTAKDLTQQTFIKLWQYRLSLSEERSVDVQCFTIANSVLVDHLRRRAVERKYLGQEQGEEQAPVCYATTDFESTDYLYAAAEKLPPVRRNIFMLKLLKGYTNKEIAEQLSISVKTVEDHYSKAIRHIRSVSLLMLLGFLAS